MKRFTYYVLILTGVMLSISAKAQLNYLPGGYITTTGTYTDLGTNGTPIITPNNNDAFSAPQPIGFTFNFNGHAYDSFVLSTNGFIKLGRDSASRHFLFTTQAQPPANGVFTSGTSPAPLASDSSMLFVFGQDLVAPASAQPYRVYTSGLPGSQVCTIQWKNVKDTLQGGVVGLWDSINFQIRLYETSNVIEYVYGNWYSSTNVNAARFSAVGIVGRSVTTANQNLHLVKGSTVAWAGTVAVTGFYINNAVNYRTPTSVPAGPAPGSGRIFSFTPVVANDAAVRVVYSQGRIALPYYIPDSIRANIVNPGTNAISSLTVTLSISGDHFYSTTATVTSLAPGGNVNVAFAPFMPSNTGNSVVTVSVPSDDNNANNVATYSYVVGGTRMAYADTMAGITGSNGTTIPNFWGAKYFVAGSGLVSNVRFLLVANSEALGDTLRGLVMDSTGMIIGASPIRIVQPGDLGSVMTFPISMPPLVTNKSIIVGVAGGTSIDGLNYFLGTSQSEVPMRPNPPFYFMTQTLAGGVTNANVGFVYANPLAWTGTRLIMECDVVPIPQVDASVSAAFPINNYKVPANTSVPLRAIVKNMGQQTRPAGIQVRYRVGSGTVIGPVSTTVSLVQNDTTSVLFSGTSALNFSTPGTYTVKVFTTVTGDSLPSNDTLTLTYTVEAAPVLPYRISNNLLSSWTALNPVTFGVPLFTEVSVTQPNGDIGTGILRASNLSVTSGTEGKILSPLFNFTGITQPVLHFQVAYGPNTTSTLADSLEVLVSTDEGYTFISKWLRSNATVPPLGTDTATSSAYAPVYSTDWRNETVDLSAYTGNSRVLIAFSNRTAGGNHLYISNIVVSNPALLSTQSVFSTGNYSLSNLMVTFSGISSSAGEISLSKYMNAPFSNASPVFATNTTSTTPNNSIFTPNHASVNEWYTVTYSGIHTGAFASAYPYTLAFNTTSASGVLSPDSIYILRRTSYNAPWQAVPTTRSSGTFSSGVLTGFYDYVLGSVSSVNPLPLSWLGIQAMRTRPQTNTIFWTTAQEVNTDYFVVERSANGTDFTAVGEVQSARSQQPENNYVFEDTQTEPFTGRTYYRVKQVDRDGQFTYSDRVVTGTLESGDVRVVNPMRVQDGIQLYSSQQTQSVIIRLTDLSGKTIHQTEMGLSGGMNLLQLPQNVQVSPGVYLLQIEGDSLVSKKLVIR